MSTTPSSTSTPASPAPTTGSWRRAWTNFWFRPADPTTLGFMRISTGLLVLYITLAYSLDLQAFFGKHAWYALSFIDRERRESPSYIPPFFRWDQDSKDPKDPKEQLISARLSDFPHRRAAFMQFLRALPEGKVPRAAALAYLSRANEMRDPDAFRTALLFVREMKAREQMERYLTALGGGKVEVTPDGSTKKQDITASYPIPPLFKTLTPEQKSQLVPEIRAFWDAFSRVQWSDSANGRDYVFNYFIELHPELRKSLVRYTESLGDESPAEQKRLLDFLEYWNYDPRPAYQQGSPIFSLWFHVTDPTQMALVHTGILVVIVLFTVGLFTRVTSVLTWLAVLSYIHRTQQVLFGMDTMMNILLFYLMIGNSGAALSLDRLIARYRAAKASLRRSGAIDANARAFLACPPPSMSAGFAMKLLQVHFCFIYMAAGLSKLKGPNWWTGQAFWDVVVNPEFTMMPHAFYEESLRFLASMKPVYYTVIWSGAVFTLFVEIGLPFLVWTRLRWFIILLAVVMHAIIAVLMGLNLFELLMIVMLLAYLPDRVVRDRFRGSPDLPKFAFTFNPGNAAQTRAAALTLALDIDNQVALTPDTAAPEPAIAALGGKPLSNSEGAHTLFRGLRLLAALPLVLWIPGVKSLLARRLFPSASAPTDAALKSATPAAR